MGRTIIVGDVHGCRDELEALLDAARFTEGSDHLVLVGDLVAKGPDSPGVLRLARQLGAGVTRGNHEEKLLSGRRGEGRLGPDHVRVAEQLSDEDWAQLEAMPLWIDLPEHDARVVHAGVVPGRPVERVPPAALIRMRTLDARGEWSDDRSAGPLWGAAYTGPPHVVFGHDARGLLQLHPWATGLDTACVYGGHLTGLALAEGEPVPRGEAVRKRLLQVPARKRYFGDADGPPGR
jgi:hypothetical protein